MLDRRTITTVMMSNVTLDAASIKRVLQLMQTQADHNYMKRLSEGLLGASGEGHMALLVEGLCAAFEGVNDLVSRKQRWFHSARLCVPVPLPAPCHGQEFAH